MIEEIEEARTHGELSALPLRNAEPFLDCEIGIEVARATVLVADLVSVGSDWIRELGIGGTGAEHARIRNTGN